MALVVKGKVNINEFIDLTKMEKILPSMFTPVKSVMCSKVDKIMVHENESLSEVNLLKGVKLIDSGYVCLAGLVVTGEIVRKNYITIRTLPSIERMKTRHITTEYRRASEKYSHSHALYAQNSYETDEQNATYSQNHEQQDAW